MENKSTILELYAKVQQDKETNTEYKRLLRKSIELRSLIDQNLTKEQKDDLDKLMTLKNDMSEQECQDFFCEGFKLATNLMIETLYNEKEYQ